MCSVHLLTIYTDTHKHIGTPPELPHTHKPTAFIYSFTRFEWHTHRHTLFCTTPSNTYCISLFVPALYCNLLYTTYFVSPAAKSVHTPRLGLSMVGNGETHCHPHSVESIAKLVSSPFPPRAALISSVKSASNHLNTHTPLDLSGRIRSQCIMHHTDSLSSSVRSTVSVHFSQRSISSSRLCFHHTQCRQSAISPNVIDSSSLARNYLVSCSEWSLYFVVPKYIFLWNDRVEPLLSPHTPDTLQTDHPLPNVRVKVYFCARIYFCMEPRPVGRMSPRDRQYFSTPLSSPLIRSSAVGSISRNLNHLQ